MPKHNISNFSMFGMCGCCRRTTASYYNTVSALAQAGSATSEGTGGHSHVWALNIFRDSDGATPPNYTPSTRLFPGQQGLYELNYANIDNEWVGSVLPPYVDLEEDVLSECDLVSCNSIDLGYLPQGFGRDNFPVPILHRNPLAAWLINGGILCIHMLGYSGDPEDYEIKNVITGEVTGYWRDEDCYVRTNSFIQFLGGAMQILPQEIIGGLTFNPSLACCLGCPSVYGNSYSVAPVTGGIPIAYCNGTPALAIQKIGQGWLIVGGCHPELPVILYKNLLEGKVL